MKLSMKPQQCSGTTIYSNSNVFRTEHLNILVLNFVRLKLLTNSVNSPLSKSGNLGREHARTQSLDRLGHTKLKTNARAPKTIP